MGNDISSPRDVGFTLDSLIHVLEDIAAWHKLDEGHGERTAKLCVELSHILSLSFDTDALQLLMYAARVHDLGRIAIEDRIITKPGPLTTSERGAVEAHTIIGYNFLARSHLPEEITLSVLYHHEKWDGTGYPTGRAGEEIPLFARIITPCDIWDALLSDRPYRRAMKFSAALNTMIINTTWFDPHIFAGFLSLAEKHMDDRL